MLGGVFGLIDRVLLGHADNDIGAFALVGMGAVFAGVVRAPITSVLIIFEMTGGYGLVLPLMIANTTAYFLARRGQPTPLYEALLEQDGHRLPHRSSAQVRIASLYVGDAMITDVVTLPPELDLRGALDRVRATGYSAFPVVDGSGHCLGVVSEARLRRRIAEGAGDAPVASEVRSGSAVEVQQPLLDAVLEMNRRGTRQIAVVESKSGRKLAGFLTMSDAMRATGERSSRITLTGVSESTAQAPATAGDD
jgi:CIC family chloride channel protein